MCGRLAFFEPQQLKDRYGVKSVPVIEPQYNFAPGMVGPVIVQNSPNRIEMMSWGLGDYKNINARAETLTFKTSFRKPFGSQRCIVPANGFYEWKQEGNNKQPYYIHSRKEKIISFAGLYDNQCFTIITTVPNQLITSIHQRMPAILKREDENKWLDSSERNLTFLSQLLRPYEGSDLEAYPVEKLVNRPGSNGADLIKRVSATEELF
ncbi:MAG: SOS response-associated peptidase [Candidatus Beckwithbacteria bacterium]